MLARYFDEVITELWPTDYGKAATASEFFWSQARNLIAMAKAIQKHEHRGRQDHRRRHVCVATDTIVDAKAPATA